MRKSKKNKIKAIKQYQKYSRVTKQAHHLLSTVAYDTGLSGHELALEVVDHMTRKQLRLIVSRPNDWYADLIKAATDKLLEVDFKLSITK